MNQFLLFPRFVGGTKNAGILVVRRDFLAIVVIQLFSNCGDDANERAITAVPTATPGTGNR